YSRESGFSLPWRVNRLHEVATVYRQQANLRLHTGILVANPVPKKHEIPAEELNPIIDQALTECDTQGIRGKDVTPYLLAKIVELTGGRSLKTNVQLALNNIRLGARIANEISSF
ncbi:MAG: pseudouridine-5'-phosphate glycosidase, partial [Candidatus Marinimicrobia bacterium]|nr:pseudouridine-5'-phosphate glycosidase [Candidatus Neomarinimicrobiota bacterium]